VVDSSSGRTISSLRSCLDNRSSIAEQRDVRRTLEADAPLPVSDRTFCLVRLGAPFSPLPEGRFSISMTRLSPFRIMFSSARSFGGWGVPRGASSVRAASAWRLAWSPKQLASALLLFSASILAVSD
jgi:hypothetical protein